MKKAIILAAVSLGFFRTKDAEKQALILEDIAGLEEMADVSRETLGATLEAEIFRRHVVYEQRTAKSVQKAIDDENKPLTGGIDSAHEHITELPPGKYVLTMAQNNTDVDLHMLHALESYCAHNGARLLVGKVTYNKNGFQVDQSATDGIYYDSKIVKYLVDGQINLGGAIDFVANANVLPTAKNPLTGFEGITKVGVSAVIPASKIALKCTAALAGAHGKIMYATGAITKRNYIARKVGQIAAAEHNIGALFVDTTNDSIVTRQLERMENCEGFYDENAYYNSNGGVMQKTYAEALQFGDIHAEKMTGENMLKMINLIKHYEPENIICHDVMDFSSRNHHNVKDCAFMFAQHIKDNTVEGDIRAVAIVLGDIINTAGFCTKVHIIESNHDLAINTWLKNMDFKLDPANALVYLKCMTALYQHIKAYGNNDFNMLQFAMENIAKLDCDNIEFHGTDESVIIAGIEMGCHGHTGVNGSRGSPTQFRTLGIPMNTGHTHTPSITGGCYTAGVAATLEMGYNIGASSWKLAHILTYPNGQRQVIFS